MVSRQGFAPRELYNDHSASLLEAILSNSEAAIVTVDAKALVRFVSAGASRAFGYDRAAVTGRSVFSFLHPDDVHGAAELFTNRLSYAGTDQGHEIRIRHSRGMWLTVRATAATMPESDLGSVAVTLRPLDAANEREDSLQRQLVVEEFSANLGARFIEAATSEQVLGHLQNSLGEIGLLTGADIVSVFVERAQRNVLPRLAHWTTASLSHLPGFASIDEIMEQATIELALREPLVVDDVGQAWDDDNSVSDSLSVVSLLSAPFDSGTQRGLLAVMRVEHRTPWLDTHAQLTRRAAHVFARALRIGRAEDLPRLTYQRGPIGFSIRTWDGTFIDCNTQYLDLLELTRGQAEAQNLHELLHPDDQATISAGLVKLHNNEVEKVHHDCRMILPDLSARWVRLNAVKVETTGWDEPLVLTSLEDVSENHAQRVALEYSARHDSLTGLVNRDTLWARIDEFAEENCRLPHLLILDLDRFKLINDSLGHSTGDQLLSAFAHRIQSNAAVLDTVARLSGDEFAIMINAPSELRAVRLAESLRRSMQKPLLAGGRSLHQTVSIGVALGDEAKDTAELIARADRAMYAAKSQGRNCYAVFNPSMQHEADDALVLERELRQAIDNEQFEVYFQPEFSTTDHQIIGAEALLRWRHPDHGLLSAAHFVEVAEQTGLIDEIGRFVLPQACLSFAEIANHLDLRHARRLKLRVNISGREFARPELVDLVQAALDDSGLAPDRLCLEMTETTLMDSPEIAMVTFTDLHNIGVQFAIDDFGTGYSSLIYLKRFPVDTLKIDRRFVQDITSDDDSAAIVESIIGLAAALELDVVAEGVENAEQLEILRALGCRSAQGHLVSEARSATDFISLFASRPLGGAR